MPKLRLRGSLARWLVVLFCLLSACGDDAEPSSNAGAGAAAGTAGTAGTGAGAGSTAATGGAMDRADASGLPATADAGPTDAGADAGSADGGDAPGVDANVEVDAGCMAPDAGDYTLEDLGTRCGACNSCPDGLTAVVLCSPICGVEGAAETCWCEFPCSTRTCPAGTACEVMVGSARGAVCRIE